MALPDDEENVLLPAVNACVRPPTTTAPELHPSGGTRYVAEVAVPSAPGGISD